MGLAARAEVVDLLLSQAGQPLAGQTVYAFSGGGAYLGVAKTTNASGAASFDVSLAAAVKFRLDRNGTQLWSPITATPGAFTFAVPEDMLVNVARDGAPLAGVTVYAYSAGGTYLGYTRTSDASGVARFSIGDGTQVKFRVDRDGRENYSAVQTAPTSFTYTLPGTMLVTLAKGGVPRANQTVYAYNDAGVYLGYSRTTDTTGVARFCIADGTSVKFRADDGGIQFYSTVATAPMATSFDLPADTVVTVTRDGAPVGNVTVYVYNEAGAYTGYSRNTDANGVVRFSLAVDARVKFRVDRDGRENYSAVQTAPTAFSYALPGTTTLTLTKGGVPRANQTVYVYNPAGTYLGYSRTTDANGVARFSIADGGSVKFRADDGGIQFYSEVVTTPVAATLELTTDTVVTVTRDGAVVGNVTVYVYNEAGAYTGYSRNTDASGVVRFSLAAGTVVKFRVDRDGRENYSSVQTAPAAFGFALPGATTLTLTKGGVPRPNQTVYVYSESGTYTGYSRNTDATGVALFSIADASRVKFRADDGGREFYGEVVTTPAAATLDLPADTVVTVTRDDAPVGNVTVYVYNEAGVFTGYSRNTDATGVVRFSLAVDARVKFRVDRDGRENYSAVQTAPVSFAYALPGTTTLTLTKGGAPRANQTVYVYNPAGTYLGYSRTTDASGVARFSIDEGSTVKFRADDGGLQFFSEPFVPPAAATLDLPSDTTVTVMRDGSPLPNTTVYVYNEAGVFTGYSKTTDASGLARFSLVVDARVKFRVDRDGRENYSAVQTAPLNFTYALPGTTMVTLTKGGVPRPNQTIYVYTAAGAYAGYSRTTDASGVARFSIDEGSTVKFRADDGGVQKFTAIVQAPASVPFDLAPAADPAPVLTSALLQPEHFVRGETFLLLVQGERIASGSITINFPTAQGNRSITQPLVLTGDSWTASGLTPADVAVPSGGAASVSIPVALSLQNSTGQTTAASASFSLVNDTTAPSLVVDQPAVAEIDVATTTITGTVGRDATALGFSRSSSPETAIPFDSVTGVFSVVLPLQEGANSFALRVRDLLGNQASVSLSLTRTPRPPVVTFTSPISFEDSVNTTSIRLLGTITDENLVQLTINGASVPVSPDGTFDWLFSLTAEGANPITVVAEDALHLKTTLTRNIYRVTQAPALALTFPATDPFITRFSTLQLAGTVGGGAAQLLVNSAPVSGFASGAFAHPVTLAAGNNILTVEVRDALGNARSLRRTVVLDQTPPAFAALTPATGFLTKQATIPVAGRVLDAQSLAINGTSVALAADGAFSHDVALAEGAGAITLSAADAAGNTTVQTITGVLDSIAPIISLDAPVSGSALASTTVAISGTVDDVSATLTLNGAPLAHIAGAFAANLPLTAAETTITLTATDSAGNIATKTATVRRDVAPPVIAYTAPAPGATTRASTVRVAGTIDDSTATVAINGRPAIVSAGRFEITDFALTEGANTLSAIATDPLGNSSAPITLALTADRTAPAAPALVAAPAYIKSDRLTLQGTAEPGSAIAITGGLAPVSVTANASGSFSALVLVTPNQASDLLLRATDALGNESTPSVHRVVSDTTAPVITVSRPADGASFDTASVEVVGTIADANLSATLLVAGQTVPLTPGGAFAVRLTLPDGASQPLTISVVDLAGNTAQLSRTITVADAAGDDDAPVIVVLSPAYDAVVPSAEISVTALVSDESALSSVTVGGVAVSPDASGRVVATVTVDANGEFTLAATDSNNFSATLTHRVQVNGVAPVAPTIQRVSPEGATSEASVLLYASALAGLRYEITGGLLPVQSGTVGADGKFVATVSLIRNTANALQVRVVGPSGLHSAPATIEVVHDSLAPVVTATTPVSGATDAAPGAPMQIVFNESVRAAELAAIEVRAAGSLVPCARVLSTDGRTLTLTPSTAFAESVNVQVTLPATLADLAGNTLGSAYVLAFRTADLTAPAAPVLASAPARVNRLALTLSGTAEPLARIEVAGASAPVSALADPQGRFALGVTLVADSANSLSVIARDAAGNASAPATLTVTHDATALVLQSSLPADAATGVALDTALRLTFNKPLDPASLAGVSLVSSGNVVAGVAVTAAEGVVTLAPAAALVSGKSYEIVVPASVADLFGNRLGLTRRIAFSTGGNEAPAAPIIYTALPVGATSLTSATLTGFSTPGTRLVIDGGASSFEFPASGVIDSTGLFTVTVPLQADAQNTLVLRARDAEGRLSAAVTALSVRQDSIAPTVLGVTPAAGALAVPVQTSVFVEFSEAIQTASLGAAVPSIRLFDALNVVIPGSWIAAGDGRSATFHPARTLAAEVRHKLLVSTSVRDLAGNALAAPFAAEFTTAAATETARPAAPVLDPLASLRTTAPSITLTGSAPAGAQVRVFGGQGGGTTTADAQGRFSVTVTLVPAAANPLAVVAVVGGALSDPATVIITQVRHAAALRLLSPQPGVQYHNRSVTVAGVIDDPASVSAITITGSGIAAPGVPATIVGRYFFRQVVLDEAAGAKSLSAAATVSSGTPLEASVAFSMQVEPAGTDTRAPIPRFIFPEAGDVLNGEVVETLLTVEEGVQLTHVEIADVVAHDVVGNIFLIHAKLPNQGANTLTVNATDAAGHVGSSSVQVNMDSIGFATAPTVAVRPAVTSERTVTLTGTAEPGATIVVLNGLVPVRAVVGPDGTYSVVVPLNPNAANQLQVVATDAAGNLSPVTTVHIAHDDTAPTVVSTTPSSGQTGVPVNATIEVRFSEALAPASVTAASAVVLRSAQGQTIQRNALLSADGKTLRITPSYKLLRGDTITVELDAAIADVHGFALGADHVFTFTTAAYQTTLSGIVVDPQLRPLANVKVGIAGTNLTQTTSSFGTFLLDAAPVGDQLLTIDARPDPATGVSPQGDARVFGYLEFVVPVRRDVDNSLGRPIFMVETDFSTATPLAASGGDVALTFTPVQKDLAGFSLTYTAGSGRFADGSARGSLTATRIDAAHIPDRLPSGAIPHFLVELGPDDLVFATPARLTFPNVYNLPVGDEVIVFHFKYGVHDYTELGRATVGADGRIVTGALLQETGFVGIVPASGSYDLTRGYLQGRVVDAAGQGLAGISVNAIAGTTYAITDAEGRYSIPLPDVRLELIRAFATVSTDLGARGGESPSLVFQSALVALAPSGVTAVPDIVVDSFFLGGGIRYREVDGDRIPVTGFAYDGSGHLASIDLPTARAVEILVYRRHGPAAGPWTYDSEPYMRTTADLDPLDDNYDSSFSLSFLGSLAAVGSGDPQARIPAPGDVVKLVAFDRATGFYGESDLKIPAASSADPQSGNQLDVIVNLELRPPQVRLDMNRVFFLDGIRRRANIPHRGLAFTGDEYIEFKTTWTTPVSTPLDRAELSLSGRLRVASIGYQTDHAFLVRGGEHARVLELREGVFANRLAVLQRETDVGVETLSVSPNGSFVPASLVPIEVTTTAYGLAQASATVAETISQNVELHILQLALSPDDDGVTVSGRTLPGGTVNVGGTAYTADGNGYFGSRLAGALGAGGLSVQVGSSLSTRFGASLAPVLNALDANPPGLVPARGAQGDTIILHGSHFSPVADDNKVSFNGAVAEVQKASESSLTVQVPELASSGDVTVTVAGKRSNAVRFEFLSVGINNGSFEDGTLRAFTLEGSGRVVERWKRVTPTHRQFMAFLDTMADPRDGVSTLTSDAFEVPEGMRTLLFDYNFVATTLLRSVHEVIELQILTESQVIVVADLFAGVGLDIHSPISGFDRGSGFRTAGVLVDSWAGTGERIRLRVVLKGRGQLPAFIPGMDRYDANPLGLGKNGGTGVFLDHFRLSTGVEPTLAPLDPATVSIISDGTNAILSAPAGTLLPGSRIQVWSVASGLLSEADIGSNGGFSLVIPFAPSARAAHFLVSYATPADSDGLGRVYAPQIKREVVR